MMEEWRDIPEYEGHYQVSNLGQARSLKPRNIGMILSQKPDHYGYCRISCRVNGIEKKIKTHRAVWLAFKQMIPDGYEIDHVNGIKSDNRPSNLEPVTNAENIRRSVLMGLHPKGETNGRSKLVELDVITIFNTPKEVQHITLAATYNVSEMTISHIRRGYKWKHLTKGMKVIWEGR